MTIRMGSLCLCLLVLFVGKPFSARQSDLDARRKQLNDLLAERWEYTMRTNPVFASMLGDKRWNDKLADVSQTFIDQDLAQTRTFLTRFEAIDTTGFPRQEVLNKTLMIRDLRMDLEGARFKPWETPGFAVQRYPHRTAGPRHRTVFRNHKRLRRLHRPPQSHAAALRPDRNRRCAKAWPKALMNPRFLAGKSRRPGEKHRNRGTGQNSPFARPFANFPKPCLRSGPEAPPRAGSLYDSRLRRSRLQEIHCVRSRRICPRRAHRTRRLVPPRWPARYRFDIRQLTTTNLTPEQIHELGLKQIDEIEAEMFAIAHQLGFKDIAASTNTSKPIAVSTPPRANRFSTSTPITSTPWNPSLPKLFGRLPKSKLAVIPMEASRAKDSVPADYTDGAPDGSRPGHINVNEYDPEHRLTLNVEAIAYHEGIPGHHLQISIAQEIQRSSRTFAAMPITPPSSKAGRSTPNAWAREVGRYQDPYSNYGRLENEMWRAIRLVVDTGVHDKHWSRDQMVAYFHRYTAMDEPNIQTEVDRYIAWPGQALAYKLGQLEILKLREQARPAARRQIRPPRLPRRNPRQRRSAARRPRLRSHRLDQHAQIA